MSTKDPVKAGSKPKNRRRRHESRYQEIAVEVAQMIADGWYKVGDKINARSTLASKYNVSPETARKAVNMLTDLGIVDIRQGSGTYVASREKAQLFVDRYQNTASMQEIQAEIEASVARQEDELAHMTKLLNTLIGQTKRKHQTTSFVPYDILIDDQCFYLGRSIGELDIWQQTGATIVAVGRDGDFIMSPGPYETINPGDILLFVGDDQSKLRMQKLFNVKETEE